MRMQIFQTIGCGLALLLLVGISSLNASQPRFDSVVAIVNDEVITYREVYDKVKESVEGIERSNLSQRLKEQQKQKLFHLALQRIVEDRLILQEAKRYKINITEETIRKKVETEIVEREDDNINIDEIDLADLVRTRLTLQQLFEKKAGYAPEEERRAVIDTYVPPHELKYYYQKNIQEFTKENRIKTRIITLYYFKNGGREQTLTKAEAIVKELRAGADFAELAKVYSNDPYAKEGGSWPRPKRGEKVVWDFFSRGEALHQEAEDIAFAMEKGEVSDPIPLENFCQIIKIEEVQKGGTVSFAEAQPDIRQKLRYEKVIAALSQIREKLRQRSYIWPPTLFDGTRTNR